MKVAIFVGPTLPEEQIRELLPDALILPPAEQGDIEYAHRQGCDVIALIDGVHRSRLPVWHKEILHVLQAGSRFLGAASMGALRAVECIPWGAEAIGEVASWYTQGLIDADDEVCVSHLGKRYHWKQTSLPLVNIRASLRAAQVKVQRANEIIAAAQDLFYPDRNWKTLFNICESDSAEQKQILDCELDIKAADALHLCYYISKLPEKPKAEREIKNHNSGYGAVFLGNDLKVWNGRQIKRLHNLAAPCFHEQALNRALALEFCKMVGISETAPETDQASPDDINSADLKRLRDEQATLARAREWFSNAGSGFMDVPKINDFLRVTGMYQKVKGQ